MPEVGEMIMDDPEAKGEVIIGKTEKGRLHLSLC